MRHLQIYTAIHRIVTSGSIRKASEYMAISPSALNRQVLSLEEELGVRLFDRVPGGLKLSTAGEVYYRSIIEHLAQIERARETIADLSGLRIGHVRIAVSPEIERSFLPAAIQAARQAHPRVRYTVVPTTHDGFARALAAHEIDLALVLQPVFTGPAETLASAEVPLVAICTAASAPKEVTFNDYLESALVLPPEGSGLRSLLEVYFRRKRLERHPIVESHRIVPPGEGPQLQFWPEIDLGDLPAGLTVVPAGPLRLPPARVILAQREGRALPIAAAKFAELLSARLAG